MSTIEIGTIKVGHLGLGRWEDGPSYLTGMLGINLSYYNAGNKEIKYLTFVFVAYNRVNDIVSNEIPCRLVGPIEPKKAASNVMFDKVWSDTTITKAVVKQVIIQYMDDTEELIDEKDLVSMRDENSAYYNEVTLPLRKRTEEENKKSKEKASKIEAQLKKEKIEQQERDKIEAEIFSATTANEYLKLIERCKDDEKLLITIISRAIDLESRYLVGDEIERRFSSNNKLMAEVVESWKDAIEYQQKYYNLPESRKLKGYPEKYAEKIKKYRPSYEMPKKAGCITIGK